MDYGLGFAEEPVKPRVKRAARGQAVGSVNYQTGPGEEVNMPDFEALSQEEGPLIPSRPTPVSLEEPPSARELIQALKEHPAVVNLNAALPGKFTGYAAFSPYELSLEDQAASPKPKEEPQPDSGKEEEDESIYFDPPELEETED
jgi:hypothetical protein